jgi:Tol biopolymer transport system component
MRHFFGFGLFALCALAGTAVACGGSERDFRPDEAGGGAAGSGGMAGGTGGTAGGGKAGGGGAGGGPVAGGPVVISTTTLPSGWFNIAYTAELAATGGTAEGYTWAITDGALPGGVELSSDGKLSGKPTVAGEFTFTVAVTDSAGVTAAAAFTLIIERKRWLAYVSNEQVQTQDLMYVADVSTTALAKTLVSTSAQTKASVIDYEFSPDGKWLAYTMDRTTADQFDLYVVNLSGAVPGGAIKVNPSGSVQALAWSPDSRRLLYSIAFTGTTGEMRYTDLSTGVPSDPPPIASFPPASRVDWATDSIVYFAEYGGKLHFSRWSNGAFGPTQELSALTSAQGAVATRDAATSRVAFASCNSAGSGIVDFEKVSVVQPAAGYVGCWSFSSDLSYAADATQTATLLYPAASLAGQPFASLPYSSLWGVSWATTSPMIVGVAGGKVVVAALTDAAATPQEVAGDYPHAVSPIFSSDDRWVIFGAGGSLYVAPMMGTTAGTAVRVNTVLPTSSGGLSASAFAPDVQAVAYVGDQETPLLYELYLVSLAGGAPSAWRKVSSTGERILSTSLGWSSDSSRLAFLGETGSDPRLSPRNLYIVDALSASLSSKAIGMGGSCSSDFNNISCSEILSYKFQP